MVFAGLIVLCLVAAAVVFVSVRNYLHSDAFRRLLSAKVSAAAGVSGEFSPFRWDGFAVDSEAFTATGDGPIRDMRIDHLHTEIVLGGLRRGVWELQGTRARNVELTLDVNQARPPQPVAREPKSEAGAPRRRWLPSKVELAGLELQETSLEVRTAKGAYFARGMHIDAVDAGSPGSHRVNVSGGTLDFPQQWMPVLRLGRARLLSQPQGVFLTGLDATAWSNARLDVSGEWDRPTGRATLDGRVSGVLCEELLSEDWARKVSGVIGSDFTIRQDPGRTVASGRLSLQNGVLTALPVLDVLAAYADTRRFRTMALSEAQADWRWQDGELVFENIVLASESFARLEGRLKVRDRQLDGRFMVGLAPGTLALVPGAETHVFQPGARGMLWAPLRITGTLDNPREDLSDRMIAAAGLRLLETIPSEGGRRVLKFSQSVLGDNPQQAVERGVKIIEEGSNTVREVSGLLDGLLGGSSEDRETHPEPQEEP